MMRTSDLQLRIGERVLVTGLDWHVEAGQCWCIIGRNGAGKSTLLRTLAGLRQPDIGNVQIHGRALADWPLEALARERAFLAQQRNDAFGYRVIDTVLAARHPHRGNDDFYWESEDDKRIAHSALAALDVDTLAERDIRTLSGGERQRVAIAAVLAQDTPLLLLDEPTNALDLAHQVSVMQLLSRLCKQSGKAVVMVSHDLNLSYRTATHALLLFGNDRWLAGPVSEAMQAPVLSHCLDHPIEMGKYNEHTLFIF